jgi:hypothetical protein
MQGEVPKDAYLISISGTLRKPSGKPLTDDEN